jgi:hypothetical protein
MQQPTESSRDEEPEEVAQIIDVSPSLAVAYPSNSADEASWGHFSRQVILVGPYRRMAAPFLPTLVAV